MLGSCQRENERRNSERFTAALEKNVHWPDTASMKFTRALPLFLLVLQATAYASIVPEKSVYSFLDIFHKKNQIIGNGAAEVYQTPYTATGELRPHKKERILIAQSDYERLQYQAMSVLQAIPGRTSKDDMIYAGTAFHIGDSLILTNNHVLSRDFSNGSRCASLKIKNHEGKTFSCKKVHYCHAGEDFCLIELAERSTGFLINTGKDSFESRPSLKLAARRPFNSDHSLITAIGNSQGHGIHVSVAMGLKNLGAGFNFFSAIRDGNSGGPVLNDAGEVIGIARTESRQVKVGKNAYNNAVAIDTVIRYLRQALADDQETLERFNRAVIE